MKMWIDDISKAVDGPQLINDSKTPSGRVHVGSLRGVLLHDVLFRALLDKSVPVQFRYGVDDYAHVLLNIRTCVGRQSV